MCDSLEEQSSGSAGHTGRRLKYRVQTFGCGLTYGAGPLETSGKLGPTFRPRTRSDAIETADGVVALPIAEELSCLDFCKKNEIRPLEIFMTPNVSPSQLNLAVGGSGVFGRMLVDGSFGGRPRGRQTKVDARSRNPYYFHVLR